MRGLVAAIRGLWLVGVIVAAAAVVGLVLWVAFVQPPWLLDTSGLSGADLAKARNDFRGTILTALGGLAVIVGAIVGGLNLRETGRQNRAVLELQRRGQVTERFTRAIDQLGQQGPDKLDVRIGAVYALEQIAQDSAELHWPIMEVLTAYLREHARGHPAAEAGEMPQDVPAVLPEADFLEEIARDWAELESSEKEVVTVYLREHTRVGRPAELPRDVPAVRTAADHQAIATVIGRRRRSQDPADQHLDLHDVDLSRVLWKVARLEGANLSSARLTGADLRKAQMEGADLRGAQLEGANLRWAQLRGANLSEAHLDRARLYRAQLDAVDLSWAQLAGAELGMAQLTGANLRWAQLEGAQLGGARLEGADLRQARLKEANLSGAQLHEADLRGAQLEGADLRKAQLAGAELGMAQLTGANLFDVDLNAIRHLTWAQVQDALNVDLDRLPPHVRQAAPAEPLTAPESGPSGSGEQP